MRPSNVPPPPPPPPTVLFPLSLVPLPFPSSSYIVFSSSGCMNSLDHICSSFETSDPISTHSKLFLRPIHSASLCLKILGLSERFSRSFVNHHRHHKPPTHQLPIPLSSIQHTTSVVWNTIALTIEADVAHLLTFFRRLSALAGPQYSPIHLQLLETDPHIVGQSVAISR